MRLTLFFDGDRNALPAGDRGGFDLAQLASGEPPPHATPMYIWENNRAVGSMIESPFSGRLKTIVAGSGAQMPGDWKRFERDCVEDDRRAFGQPPGPLVGVLTDSDNTGTNVDALDRDIRLLSSPP